MIKNMSGITPIGKTDWRDSNQIFGIRDKDRLAHLYAIGKSGTGKSTLLLNMAISDIERGNGCCIIDPHGDVAETLLKYVPESRIDDVIYFNATDTDFPVGFNPFNDIQPESYSLVTSAIVSTFKKVWSDSWGPRMEHILRFSVLTLLHHPKATLLDIQRILTDTYFRNGVLYYVTDQGIQNFWLNEFDKYAPAFKNEVIAPILNKIGLLTASTTLRNIVGQQKSRFVMKQVMDERKILICNLSKGIIGEDASSLLGAFLLTAIQSTALQRASYEPDKRIPFYVYADEIHSFATYSFADMLAEVRKFGVSLFLTHQFLEQLDPRILSAILGNAGTVISFRVGATDGEYLQKEFYPVFKTEDFVHLPRYAMYVKLMIDGATSRPFSAVTLPIRPPSNFIAQSVVETSQNRHGVSKKVVEQLIEASYRSSKIALQRTLF